ncbi:MAG: xanthine dehydrogenase family protein subunit M [Saprospiraceae bacterium]|nr:xanthine dehydrogenase family protein subunit M [Saprospiraceae bacterium]
MIPGSFDYSAPSTLEEAISLLQQHGDEAKILSGGHSLIPMMKLRLASPGHVIDINRIPDLDYINEEEGFLKIGALVRESDLEESDLIRTKYQVIYDATKMIADPSVRNVATVAGNLAHGDAANDHPAVMLALGADLIATGPNGTRTIPITEFFQGFFTTALEADEILTEIRIPVPPANSSGTYLKLERKVGDYATAGVAVQLTLDAQATCTHAGIGLTNVGDMPIEAVAAEQALIGQKLDDERLKTAAQLASDASDPMPDLRGSTEYKKNMVRVLTYRALKQVIEQILS